MTWATDGEPRFVVTSVTGYGLTGGAGQSGFYQVLDRPYCYALVSQTPRREDAEEGARELNGGNMAWPHGFDQRLWSGKQASCKCEPCTTRRTTVEREMSARRRARKAAAAAAA